MSKTAECPTCKQDTSIITRQVAGHGRRRMLCAHDYPDWPRVVCPGSHTVPQ